MHFFKCFICLYNFLKVATSRLPVTQATVFLDLRSTALKIHFLFFYTDKMLYFIKRYLFDITRYFRHFYLCWRFLYETFTLAIDLINSERVETKRLKMGLKWLKCGSERAHKYGRMKGDQRYRCKNCGYQYTKTTPRG